MNKQRRNLLAGGAVLLAAGVGVSVKALAEERVIKVVARKFVFLPNDIALKKGETVILEFSAPEVVMGFNLPDYKLRTDIIPGQVSRVKFTADKAGTFPFLCDIFCGEGHEGMSGKIVVT
ncbi:MAG TPA: cupredoxin domain-containing protein [Usitatibacter sp.]|nr:cupredoxin domain-containing protein [Usitatibacter sp.]